MNYDGELSDMFVIDNDTVFILSYMDKSGQNTVLFQSNDGGNTWNKKEFPKIDKGGFRSIFCLTASTIFASGVDGLYKTVDGGNNWSQIGLSEQMEGGIMHFFDNNIGLVCRASSILKTDNGGSNFDKVFDTVAVMTFNQFQFLDEQIGYASGGAEFDYSNFGIVVKTLDEGNTWEPVPEQFQNVISMSFISPEIGFVITSSILMGEAKLLKTSDAGETWQSINDHLFKDFKILPGCCFENELNGFLYGWEKILSTIDGGKTWTEEFKGDLTISPTKMIITKSNTAYALCNNNYLLKRIN